MNPSSQPSSTQIVLDYTSITQPVTSTDINTLKQKYELKNRFAKPLYVVGAFLLTVIIAIIMVIAVIFSLQNGDGVPYGVLVWAVIGAVVVTAMYFANKYKNTRFVKLDRFATQNNLTCVFNRSDPAYSGMIFDEGHSRVLNEALQFSSGFEIGNYTYVTGYGRDRTTHEYGYAKITLSRKLPHMFLDAKGNNFLGFSGLPDSFNRSQTLSLEGNFDKYFQLYAPKEYERDALYVFTPDVMACLIDNGKKYDMEVVDDNLFIYSGSHFNLLSQAHLEPLLSIVEKIGAELRSQTDSYKDERVSDRAQNIVADPGKRLKKGVNYTVVAIVVVYALYYVVQVVLSLSRT